VAYLDSLSPKVVRCKRTGVTHHRPVGAGGRRPNERPGVCEYCELYISMAKDMHISLGHTLNEFLSREARRGTRSGTRGRGAAKQDGGPDLDAAFRLDIGSDPLVPGGMYNFIGPRGRHILCPRETELTTLLASAEKLEVTVALPVTKTDPQSDWVHSHLGCVCGGQLTTPGCYYALIVQLDGLDRKFPNGARADLHLFPQSNGDAASKVSALKSLEHIACMLGENLVDLQGRNRFGGHYIRVTGARRLARLAIPTASSMLLARWSSFVILRYIRETPLKTHTLTSTGTARRRSLRMQSIPSKTSPG